MENIAEAEVTTFSLRLPKDLDEAVQLKAQTEKRSKNSQIVFILEKFIDLNSEKVPVAQAGLSK